MKLLHFPIFILYFLLLSCSNDKIQKKSKIAKNNLEEKQGIPFTSDAKTIHIFVALCDNKYQGIVPVHEKIGNGQDPDNNLYWGCAFGVRSYFKKSREWKFIEIRKLKSEKLERIIFKHVTKNYYLVADAYDGKFIKESTIDFLNSSNGRNKDTLNAGKTTIGIGGNSKLLAYVGHDGLMDFQLNETFENTDQQKRDVIILACYSKKYFSPHLAKANVNPIVWTTGLMSPEAYTLHDAISGYVLNESNEQIRTRAAKAYSKYQKCSEKAARNLLVTSIQ
ncbi:hypothetical protein LNP04_03160 [Chryseobacterium sp. C-71]|uniref:hypothetical protein n=1 Tax=Chryseobacterium sp. C-71 TaxID=2893882 RepID=UPI001E5D1536|nr:hypothetical protein [Chryseobacterium sp. C-71]UFH32731.1 hypothetical protein LNP04_03160 [Chryseobacterium sp. C-71]